MAGEQVINPETIQSVANLPWYIAVMALLAFLIWRHYASKDRKQDAEAIVASEEAKAARAKQYTAAFNNLSKSIQTSADQTSELLGRTHADLTEVKARLADVVKSARGKMRFGESLGVIDAYYSSLCRFTLDLFSRSLQENHYDADAELIEIRCKTRLAEQVVSIRDDLRRLRPLSIDPDEFFTTIVNSPGYGSKPPTDISGSYRRTSSAERVYVGERFDLIDQAWTVVQPFYIQRSVQDQTNTAQVSQEKATRIEAAVLNLQAFLKDYRDDAVQRLHESRSRDSGESNGGSSGTGTWEKKRG